MKTQPLNEMKLVFPSSSANESFARAAVSAFAAQLILRWTSSAIFVPPFPRP